MNHEKFMLMINDWPTKGNRQFKIFDDYDRAKIEADDFLSNHIDFDNNLFISRKTKKFTLIINNHPSAGNRKVVACRDYRTASTMAEAFLAEHADMENELLIINGEIIQFCLLE